MTAAIEEQTIYPPQPGSRDVEVITDLRQALAGRPELRGPHGAIALPPDMYEVLVKVVDALSQGLAVSLTPHHTRVSTQEAADILGVARTSVVRWIEEGRLDCEQPGRHRRLLLADVMEFKQRRRREQHAVLDEVAADELAAGLVEA